MNRREIIGLFGLALAARYQSAEPDYLGLDHIEFYVSNVEKSRDFFVRLFGNTLKSRNGKRYLKLGSTYMAFEAPRGNGDRFGWTTSRCLSNGWRCRSFMPFWSSEV